MNKVWNVHGLTLLLSIIIAMDTGLAGGTVSFTNAIPAVAVPIVTTWIHIVAFCSSVVIGGGAAAKLIGSDK